MNANQEERLDFAKKFYDDNSLQGKDIESKICKVKLLQDKDWKDI